MWKLLTKTSDQRLWRICTEFANHDDAVEEMAIRAESNPHRFYRVATAHQMEIFTLQTTED